MHYINQSREKLRIIDRTHFFKKKSGNSIIVALIVAVGAWPSLSYILNIKKTLLNNDNNNKSLIHKYMFYNYIKKICYI